MSQQALDLRKSVQLVRRHKLLMGIAIALGFLAGVGYSVARPPMLTSTAQVLLPESSQAALNGAQAADGGAADPYTSTQEVIAESNPVLSAALPDVRPAMSLDELRSHVDVGSLTPYVISINVAGKSAADAEADANAVAKSYIRYIGAPGSPGGATPAQLLQAAASASGPSPLLQLIAYAVLGAAAGALIGVVIILAVSRSDRRLRERDQMANAIGVPVLASFPVEHPTDAGGWTKLLETYTPGALHALQLRRTLQQLEMAAAEASGGGHGDVSCTVLSLSSDPRALAVGPQLAAFAAGQGIPTALVIGPQQDPAAAATLRTACAAAAGSPIRRKHLQLLVADGDAEVQPSAALTVVVAVVDGRNPQVPHAIRTMAALLGVSVGAATADQLARVAVSAVSGGRDISGILVADPDAQDATTGRLPQLGRRSYRRLPTRTAGMATEIRR